MLNSNNQGNLVSIRNILTLTRNNNKASIIIGIIIKNLKIDYDRPFFTQAQVLSVKNGEIEMSSLFSSYSCNSRILLSSNLLSTTRSAKERYLFHLRIILKEFFTLFKALRMRIYCTDITQASTFYTHEVLFYFYLLFTNDKAVIFT